MGKNTKKTMTGNELFDRIGVLMIVRSKENGAAIRSWPRKLRILIAAGTQY
jgi:hypothetical protein